MNCSNDIGCIQYYNEYNNLFFVPTDDGSHLQATWKVSMEDVYTAPCKFFKTIEIDSSEVWNVNLDDFTKNDFLLPNKIVEKIKTFHQAQQNILEMRKALEPFELIKIEKEGVIPVETSATKDIRERLGASRIFVTYAAMIVYNYYFQTKVGEDSRWVKYTPLYDKASYTDTKLEELDSLEDVDQYIEENKDEFKLIEELETVENYKDMNKEWRVNSVNFFDEDRVVKIAELAENFFVLEKTKDWIFENKVSKKYFPENPLKACQDD